MNDLPEVEPTRSPYADSPSTASITRPHGKGRTTAAIFGMTLLAGMVGGAWLMKQYGPADVSPTASVAAAPGTGDSNAANPPSLPQPQADTSLTPSADTLATDNPAGPTPNVTAFQSSRIAALEQRIAEINLQARAAGGNASRAEGLLVAFAARRAVERGQSLGYIDSELRQRFGSTMPRAVMTIIEASTRRVTADKLREKLETLEPILLSQDGSAASMWSNLTNLFVVRSENAPIVDPAQRLLRAKRALDIGRVDRAVLEVEKMPGAARAGDWLTSARHYNEAQQALDLIESAAIQDPQNLRDFGVKAGPAPAPSPAATPLPTE